MNLNDSKSYFFNDKKRTTMFPSLKKNIEAKSFRPREMLGFSMDEKQYRMTSNQIIKGIIKQNDTQIKQLRSTFMKHNFDQPSKKKIGHYQIGKDIGKGGFAQVY